MDDVASAIAADVTAIVTLNGALNRELLVLSKTKHIGQLQRSFDFVASECRFAAARQSVSAVRALLAPEKLTAGRLPGRREEP